jgi:flagellar biosynthetic protein FlhB
MAGSGEKTEKPTEKRLREARRKGQVSKSQDLTSAILLIAVAGVFTVAGRWAGTHLTAFTHNSLADAASFQGQLQKAKAMEVLLGGATTMAMALAPLFGAMVVLAILVNYFQIGPIFSLETIKPNLNKLNPAEGFKNKFLKARPYIELLKTVIKMIVICAVIYYVIWNNRSMIIELARKPIPQAISVLLYLLIDVMLKVGIAFLILALGDFFLQRFLHMKDLKMTKQEVKDEYKETEGNPLHKVVRRQLHREVLAHNLKTAVQNANVVVVNPTHLAVALVYDNAAMNAPTVVAKGADLMAAHLREIAAEAGVPIMRDVPLARALFEMELEEEIPEELYEAVAVVLRWVYQLAEERGEISHV